MQIHQRQINPSTKEELTFPRVVRFYLCLRGSFLSTQTVWGFEQSTNRIDNPDP